MIQLRSQTLREHDSSGPTAGVAGQKRTHGCVAAPARCAGCKARRQSKHACRPRSGQGGVAVPELACERASISARRIPGPPFLLPLLAGCYFKSALSAALEWPMVDLWRYKSGSWHRPGRERGCTGHGDCLPTIAQRPQRSSQLCERCRS